MFNPTIGPNTMTVDIQDQVVKALTSGESVRLGRWVASPTGSGPVSLTRYSEESRSGPLTGAVPMGSACPEWCAADIMIDRWKRDW